MDSISKNVLVIAPHHDDESIGCGGTIALLTSKGYSVSVVHVYEGSSGVRSRYGSEAKSIRTQESVEAARIGNFSLLPNLDFEDRVDHDETRITHALIRVIRQISPQIIFVPHEDEQDEEHRIVNKASWEAAWLSTTSNFPELGNPVEASGAFLGYEIWRPISSVQLYIDISDFTNAKREMISAYASQIELTSWVEGALGLSAYRGTVLQGSGHAEAFTLKGARLSTLIQQFTDLLT